MKWTFTKPTKPGWYWYRVGMQCVYVRGRAPNLFVGLPGDPPLAQCHGEWSDEPIPEPSSDREGP